MTYEQNNVDENFDFKIHKMFDFYLIKTKSKAPILRKVPRENLGIQKKFQKNVSKIFKHHSHSHSQQGPQGKRKNIFDLNIEQKGSRRSFLEAKLYWYL